MRARRTTTSAAPSIPPKGWSGGVLLGERCQRSLVRIMSRSTTPCLICLGHICLGDRVRSAVRTRSRSRFVASTTSHLVHMLHSPPARGRCGASKGAVPKGARHGRRTHAAERRAGQPERRPTRSRMLGECSIRELVASFEEAHLPLQPIERVTLAGSLRTARARTMGHANRSIVAWAC